MASNVDIAHTDFTSGELSPFMLGRHDLDQYSKGAQLLENFLTKVQGGIMSRQGTELIFQDLKKCRLERYEPSVGESYILQFQDLAIRILDPYSKEVKGTVVTPYTEDQIDDVAFSYSVDVVYLVHPSHPPAILYNVSATSWFYEEIPFERGPYVVPDLDQKNTKLYFESVPEFKVSVYKEGEDFSSLTLNQYVAYSYEGEWNLGRFQSTDGSNDRAILIVEKAFVRGLDPATRIEFQSSATFNYIGGPFSNVISTDKTVFTEELVGAFFRFEDITNTGTANIVSWVQITDYYGLDVAGSGFYYHGGVNPSEVDVCITGGKLTIVKDLPFIDDVRSTDSVGNSLNTVTLKSDTDIFSASTDMGRSLQLTLNNKVYEASITSYVSAKEVTVTLDRPLTYTNGVLDNDGRIDTFQFGAFYTGNYPRAVAFHEQRLCLAGTESHKENAWISQPDDYYNFSLVNDNNEVVDSSGISFSLAGQPLSKIKWLSSANTLVIGTDGSEWQLRTEGALTPSSFRLVNESTLGTSLPPIQVDSMLLMINRPGKKLREFEYDFRKDGYTTDDITLISDHIFRRKDYSIIDLAYQREPNSVIWLVRSDGELCALTYYRNQEVYSWTRHKIAETSAGEAGNLITEETGNIYPNTRIVTETGQVLTTTSNTAIFSSPQAYQAKVESICTLTDPTTSNDNLFMVVNREGKRSLEQLSFDFEPRFSTDWEDMAFLDGHTVFSSDESFTELTGLDYYDGTSITIIADGVVVENAYSLSGTTYTLATPASYVVVGYKYIPALRTMPVYKQLNAPIDTQGRIKRITGVNLRLLWSLGFKHGTDLNDLIDEDFSNNDDILNGTDLYTGDVSVTLHEDNNRTAQIYIVQDKPYPLNITSMVVKGEIY